MTVVTTGYSDRINHALAFAAKHHDQQVRRGVRLPYLTQPPNVAIILTRYGQTDETVIAGILLNVVKDYVNDGTAADIIKQRIGDKFGGEVLEAVLAAVPARSTELLESDADARRVSYLRGLAQSPENARWVVAADALHEAATLLADLRRTIDRNVVWARRSDGRGVAWYRDLVDALRRSGFNASIVDELDGVVGALERER